MGRRLGTLMSVKAGAASGSCGCRFWWWGRGCVAEAEDWAWTSVTNTQEAWIAALLESLLVVVVVVEEVEERRWNQRRTPSTSVPLPINKYTYKFYVYTVQWLFDFDSQPKDCLHFRRCFFPLLSLSLRHLPMSSGFTTMSMAPFYTPSFCNVALKSFFKWKIIIIIIISTRKILSIHHPSCSWTYDKISIFFLV